MITVAHISKTTGISAHTIRYYAKMGLLDPTRDPDNNYQIFSAEDLKRLRFISRAKQLGFKLNEIKQILNDAYNKKCTCKKVRSIIQKRIDENRKQLQELMSLQTRMEEALAAWDKLPGGNPKSDNVSHLIETWDQ